MLHARAADEALVRLEGMALLAALPLEAARGQIEVGMDLLVVLGRGRENRRGVVQVAEVAGELLDVVRCGLLSGGGGQRGERAPAAAWTGCKAQSLRAPGSGYRGGTRAGAHNSSRHPEIAWEALMLVAYLATAGGLALVVVVLSRKLRDWPVSEPALALLLGVLIGPEVLGWVEVAGAERAVVLRRATELMLAITLIAVALRFPVTDIQQQWRRVVLMLVVVMPAMATVATVLGLWLLPLAPAAAWLLGAAICPTDPALSSSVVTGEPAERSLPKRLRVLLSTESGANDGLAFPLVAVGLVLVLDLAPGHEALRALWKVGGALVIGSAMGATAGLLLRWAQRHHDTEKSAFLVYALALGLCTLGVAELAGASGVFAVFVAGLACNRTMTEEDRQPEHEIEEGVNRVLVLPLFILLGVALPWSDWAALGWRGVVFAIGVLLLRRLPLVLALRRPLSLRPADALFLGWFGPIGVAALYYLVHAEEQGVRSPGIWAAGSLVVVASTLAHGITATPLRNLYRRRVGLERAEAGVRAAT